VASASQPLARMCVRGPRKPEGIPSFGDRREEAPKPPGAPREARTAAYTTDSGRATVVMKSVDRTGSPRNGPKSTSSGGAARRQKPPPIWLPVLPNCSYLRRLLVI